MTDEGQETKGRSPWWRQIATLLTITGLVLTLVFNTLAVRNTARQTKESRVTQQVSLLTQLDSSATDAEQKINETGASARPCNQNTDVDDLEAAHEAVLRRALRYYEYLAWLFNGAPPDSPPRLTVGREYFDDRMINGWRLALRYLGRDEVESEVPELTRFVDLTPAGKQPSTAGTCPNG